MKYKPEEVKLDGLVNEVISNLQINADEKQIKINSDLPVNLTSHIDKLMISTVLRNLISNAIKFSSEKSQINIFSKVDNDMIEITVKDFGKGLSKTDVTNTGEYNTDIRLDNLISSVYLYY